MTPWLSDPDVDIYVGDALDVLRGLPDGSVDCCVTSPPYWGLRDYGTEGQLGLEATPDLYVAAMVAVFAEVRRVLADHGTLWLNIGDTYHGGGGGNYGTGLSSKQGGQHLTNVRNRVDLDGLKPKDLCGIPWRLAFALQADGWWLRSDIIWAKPNPMPESVTDRPTKAHEYVFLLTKRPRYWFDAEAVREPHNDKQGLDRFNSSGGSTNGYEPDHQGWVDGGGFKMRPGGRDYNPAGRNVRSVWEIATQPYPDAHFATFPEELARRSILAGCPEWVCGVCGKARERIVERELVGGHRVNARPFVHGKDGSAASGTFAGGEQIVSAHYETETVGWSDCGHNAYRPGTVLDPFLGSGTTAHVARKHGLRCVGIELNEEYAQLAARRLQQLSLLAEGGYA